MEYKLIDVAYGALLHDIGKFYQRTMPRSDLSDAELEVTKYHKDGNYYSHLHSGYTSRFMKKYLKMFDEFEMLTSEHHKDENNRFHSIIKKADHIASKLDRQDERFDNDEKNKRGSFITSRLHSVLGEVDFGNTEKYDMVFPLNTLENIQLPIKDYVLKNKEDSAEEYNLLFKKFVEEVEKDQSINKFVDYNSFNHMYNLMNRYLVTIPASTYENSRPTVSLFDHLKLTSAIASCLYDETCFETEKFYMLEIDISGIQSFIYKITEGSDTKKGLTKALRGRSALIGIISNAVAYSFIYAFGLTPANILFNTGGGSLILLPYNEKVKTTVGKISKDMRKKLFEIFHTDITFVDALIELNRDELEEFQQNKSIELRELLGRNKMRKFHDIISKDFFFEKTKNNSICEMCGNLSEKSTCSICQSVDDISFVYTHYDEFGIVYDFGENYSIRKIKNNNKEININFGFVNVFFVDELKQNIDQSFYVDSINQFGIGQQKMIANSVPVKKNQILNFEDIIKLTSQDYGDEKLAILKMDVDNLGAIFAFGLKKASGKEDILQLQKQRSISKYVTMSRLLEYFFGHEIVNICKEKSKEINPDITKDVDNETLYYINFAGGDDLVIIGSAYSIIVLAQEIYSSFYKFAGNKNITISGGIHIQNSKRPIRFGIQEAEKQLEISKLSNGKNSISMLNTRIDFPRYNEFLKDVYIFRNLIRNEKVSRTMIYNIMSNISDKDYGEYIPMIPRIQYIIYRNIDKKEDSETHSLVLKYINSINNDQTLNELVLKLKLAIMFTREDA